MLLYTVVYHRVLVLVLVLLLLLLQVLLLPLFVYTLFDACARAGWSSPILLPLLLLLL